jgi:hypothetical protein
MLYGGAECASTALRAALGLRLCDAALEGDFDVDVRLPLDRFAQAAEPPPNADASMEAVGLRPGVDGGTGAQRLRLRHRALVSGGGLRAACDRSDPGLKIMARQGRHERAYAVCRAPRAWRGGRLAWIQTTVSIRPEVNSLEPVFDEAWSCRLPFDWPRRLLAQFGIDIVQERRDATVKPAQAFVKRRQGAWVVVGHKPNTSVRFWARFPDGAPAYAENETPIVGGYAGESFGKTFVNEVRAFVRMDDGIVHMKEMPVPIGYRRHFCISNLRKATVTVYPDPRWLRSKFRVRAAIGAAADVPHSVDAARGAVTVPNHTGALYVAW